MSDGANCIVTWVDAGTPDHHILVAHFSTDGDRFFFNGPAIPIAPEKLLVLDGQGEEISNSTNTDIASSTSDLAAAYVDGRFWIAFKSASEGWEGTVNVVQTKYRDLDRWREQLVFSEDLTVDGPGFVFDPYGELTEMGLTSTTLYRSFVFLWMQLAPASTSSSDSMGRPSEEMFGRTKTPLGPDRYRRAAWCGRGTGPNRHQSSADGDRSLRSAPLRARPGG